LPFGRTFRDKIGSLGFPFIPRYFVSWVYVHAMGVNLNVTFLYPELNGVLNGG